VQELVFGVFWRWRNPNNNTNSRVHLIYFRNLWSVETGHPMATISGSSLVGQSVSRILVQESLMKTNDRHSTIPVSRHLLPSSAERKETCTCQVYLQISRIPRGLGGVSSLGCYGFRRKGQRKLRGYEKSNIVTKPRCVHSSSEGVNNDDAMGGDPRVQQMLVEMVQIQMGKTRMSDFVGERSQYMRSIAQETHQQYDRIAYRTMKGLDDTSARVLRQLDADAHAIERELRNARAELEAQQRDFEEFQRITAYSRNEGLFFKNLYPSPSRFRLQTSTLSKGPFKEQVIVVKPSRDFSSSYKQVLYGGLSLVIVSFIWSSSSAFLAGTGMRASKLMSYGIIISALLTQLAYAKVLVGDEEEEDKDKENKSLEPPVRSQDSQDNHDSQ
jgi:hypothetical protein